MTNWLLLRGLVREQRHWAEFPGELERAMTGSRAFCLDLPGTGTEFQRKSPLTIHGIADDVRSRWLPLRDANPGVWGIIGISLGGMTALDWSSRHRSDFSRIIVINSSAGDLSPPYHRLKPAVLPQALGSFLSFDPVAREEAILRMTTRLRTDVGVIAKEWARLARERPLSRGTAARQIAAASRFRAPASLDLPALVISARGDRFTDPSCSERLASALSTRTDCATAVHPDAGHDLPLDDPRWLALQIARWAAPVG